MGGVSATAHLHEAARFGALLMAKLYKHRQEVTAYTTPAELRLLATQMEQMWDESLPGDRTVVVQWLSEELVINVALDQSRIGRPAGSKMKPVEAQPIAA